MKIKKIATQLTRALFYTLFIIAMWSIFTVLTGCTTTQKETDSQSSEETEKYVASNTNTHEKKTIVIYGDNGNVIRQEIVETDTTSETDTSESTDKKVSRSTTEKPITNTTPTPSFFGNIINEVKNCMTIIFWIAGSALCVICFIRWRSEIVAFLKWLWKLLKGGK